MPWFLTGAWLSLELLMEAQTAYIGSNLSGIASCSLPKFGADVSSPHFLCTAIQGQLGNEKPTRSRFLARTAWHSDKHYFDSPIF